MTIPFHGYNLADDEHFLCKVYKDHPEWNKHEKWWMMPSHLLRELYVETYQCYGQDHLDVLEKMYPDHIFVY